ncbi:hypothetical protein EDC04DRAFT_2681483, partial [Pisolithus marmoratus]
MYLLGLLGILWCLAALGRCAVAGPIAPRGVEDDQSYAPPLIVLLSISIALFSCFTVKIMYMKYRRVKTIHEHPSFDRGSGSLSSTSSSRRSARERDPNARRPSDHSGLIIGCLGSPTWETRIHSRVDNQVCPQLSMLSRHTHLNRKIGTRWSPETRSGLATMTNSSPRVVESTSHLGSIRGLENTLALSSIMRPPQTFTFDSEGMRKTVHLVPRVLSGSGDGHPTTDSNCSNKNIDGIESAGPGSPRSSIRLINRPPEDLPHACLYGPLGISRLSPLLGAADSVSLPKTAFEYDCKPFASSPSLPENSVSDMLTSEQLRHPASASAHLPNSRFLSPPTLVRSVTKKREDAAYEAPNEKWNTGLKRRKACFQCRPVGASPLRASLIPEDGEYMSLSLTSPNDDENQPSVSATSGETPDYAALLPPVSCAMGTTSIPNNHPRVAPRLGVRAMTLFSDTDLRNDEASIRTQVSEDALTDATPGRFCLDSQMFYEENAGWPAWRLPSPEIGVAR